MATPTYIEWFAGVGGFRLALDAAGFRCVWSCEIDPKCRRVYAERFGHEPQAQDIRSVDPAGIPDADLWLGGFPCQDLSVAGRRKGLRELNRSGLVFRLLELAAARRLPWILLENVSGLFSSQGGADFGLLLAEMGKLWPAVGWATLDAQHFGVPQRRRRVFFIGGPGIESVRQVLFESESRQRDLAQGEKERSIAAGEIARSLGGVGGGQDFGANKGTLVQETKANTEKDIVKQAVSSKWAKNSSGPSGDEHHNLVIGTIRNHVRPGSNTDLTVVCENGSDIQVQKTKAPCLRNPKAQTKNAVAFIHTADAGQNQDPVKRDDKSDALDTSGPGAVAFEPRYYTRDNKTGGAPKDKAGITNAHKAGDSAPFVFQPRVARNDRGAPDDVSPPLTAEAGQTGKGDSSPHVVQTAPTIEEHYSRTGNERTEAERLVAFTQNSRSEVRELGEKTGAVTSEPGAQQQNYLAASLSQRMRGQDDACADNVQPIAPMQVRRLTPTECERLQGFADGHTCLCGTRSDCPDRRIPRWLDPKTFHLGGCGHSACGCRCSEGQRYKQMGNAVAVPVIRWIADRLYRQIGQP